MRAAQSESDPRGRGLAFYVAMKCDAEKATPIVARGLKSKHQLLRFDAFSALMMSGGERGKELVEAHMKGEEHPWLKGFWERNRGR